MAGAAQGTWTPLGGRHDVRATTGTDHRADMSVDVVQQRGSDVSGQWRPSRVEVDLDAVRHNVARLRELAGVDVCAVVKADGYGHGAAAVARAALDAGASWLAVALVEEGIALRDAGIDAPVLLLAEPPVAAIDALLGAELTPMAYSRPFLDALDVAGRDRGRRVTVHVKADTGMGRVGIPESGWDGMLDVLAAADRLAIDGFATHLARADEPTLDTTARQLDAFDRFLAAAAHRGIEPRWIHAANSAGTIAHPRARHTLVRCGIGIYGLSPSGEVDAADAGLRGALRLTSEVAYAKRIAAGTPVSYGHRWQAPADGWIATVPIGYADGVPRSIGGSVEVAVAGRRCPLVGTVCMDQVMVWCADDEPRIGDTVELLGGDGPRVETWAKAAGTITYEIATGLTGRLPRIHVGV